MSSRALYVLLFPLACSGSVTVAPNPPHICEPFQPLPQACSIMGTWKIVDQVVLVDGQDCPVTEGQILQREVLVDTTRYCDWDPASQDPTVYCDESQKSHSSIVPCLDDILTERLVPDPYGTSDTSLQEDRARTFNPSSGAGAGSSTFIDVRGEWRCTASFTTTLSVVQGST